MIEVIITGDYKKVLEILESSVQDLSTDYKLECTINSSRMIVKDKLDVKILKLDQERVLLTKTKWMHNHFFSLFVFMVIDRFGD